MTRKTFLILAIMACILFPLSAFDYRLDLISLTPLYEEYDADNHRASLDFQYGAIYQGYPEGFYQNDNYFPFVDSDVLRIRPFVATYHMGETLSLLKNTFTFDHWLSPIAFDFAFQGSLTGVLEGEVADTIGYDGEYFFGMTMSIADVLSFRFGGSHYCSHYGDGSYKVIETGGGVPDNFDEWFKYLRMDSMIFGLSLQPVDFVRVYAEIDFATKNTSVLPYYFEPEWGPGNSIADDLPSSYGARIVNFGIEFEYPIFKFLGMTRIAYGCAAYEEGKIVYRHEDLAAAGRERPFYDPNRPWEFEHTINISQEINDLVSFDITWHYGRFMLNSYYDTKSQYVTIGARLDFDGTVTLYDSARD